MRVKKSFLNSKSVIKYLFLFLMIGLYSCDREKPSDLVGVWEIDQLKISMKTYQNSDSTQVVEVSGKNWEEKMNLETYKPIIMLTAPIILCIETFKTAQSMTQRELGK